MNDITKRLHAGVIERQRQQLEDYAHANIADRQEMARLRCLLEEAQAREKVLRDALSKIESTDCGPGTLSIIARVALAQPTDDTALKAALAAEFEKGKNSVRD